MKKIFFRSLAGVLVAILIIAAVFLVRHRKAQLANKPPPKPRPVAVFVKFGQWGSLAVTRYYIGSIEPEAEAVLTAQSTDYIAALNKNLGGRLQKGEATAVSLSFSRLESFFDSIVTAIDHLSPTGAHQ